MNRQTKAHHICSHRHAFSLDNFLRRLLLSPGRIIGPYIKPGQTIIDVGCGPGFFTIFMAEAVGDKGRVIAVDVQQEMLDKVQNKLNISPAGKNVTLHQCGAGEIGLDSDIQADFILAYYMVHECRDQLAFFLEIQNHLKNAGKLLVVEPPVHVSRRAFRKTVETAEQTGLQIIEKPKWKGGMCVLLTKGLKV